MRMLSISFLADITDLDRETVAKRLANLQCERANDAPNAAKNYNSVDALPILLGIDPGKPGEKITNLEASRRLTLARERQVIVETEVKSGERLHRDDVSDAMSEYFGNIAAIIKGRADALGKDAVSDIFRQLRECAEKLCIASSLEE
jgi:hypothetical protein